MMSVKYIRLDKLLSLHESRRGGLVVVVDFTGGVQELAIVSTEQHNNYKSLEIFIFIEKSIKRTDPISSFPHFTRLSLPSPIFLFPLPLPFINE